MNESLFRGRQLTVVPKYKTIRGFAPRGGGFRGGRGGRAMMTQLMNLLSGGRGFGYRGGFRGGRGGFRGARGRGGGPPQGQMGPDGNSQGGMPSKDDGEQ